MSDFILTPQILEQAQIIWDYMRVGEPIEPADLIIAFGTNDERVAEHAADLILANVAPYLIYTGGIAHVDDLLATGWEISEAEMFQQIALKKGVPANKIILENEAPNTSKNLRFSLPLARAHGLKTDRILFVCKPYSERRILSTAAIEWRDELIKYNAASAPGNFADYFSNESETIKHLHLMVGDLHRIARYPALGLQAAQEIPDEVVYAFNTLVELGFDGHLVPNKPRVLLP